MLKFEDIMKQNSKKKTSEGDYVCYCSHVTKEDLIKAIKDGAKDVKTLIEVTGAMKNSNCAVNNPKGTCCYGDIVKVFQAHSKK